MSSFAGLVHAHAVRDDLGDGARGRGNALFSGHENDVVVADVDATCSSVAAPRIAISGRLSAALGIEIGYRSGPRAGEQQRGETADAAGEAEVGAFVGVEGRGCGRTRLGGRAGGEGRAWACRS